MDRNLGAALCKETACATGILTSYIKICLYVALNRLQSNLCIYMR